MSTATSTTSVTPPVTVAAYSAGNGIGGVMKFAGALNQGWSGVLQSLLVTSKSIQTTGLKLYLFSDLPVSLFADKAAPSLLVADIPKLIGVYTLGAADSGLGTETSWQLDAIGKAFSGVGPDLYGLLIAVATPTWASVSDITVNVSILKDR